MNKEKIIVFLLAAGILFLVNLPLLYFYIFPREGLVFLGRRVINSQDTYTYISFIEESKQGKLLLDNLYTSQNQQSTIVRPLYIILGKIASFFSISSIEIFHIARIALSIIFIAILYRFLFRFFDDPKKRIFAFTLLLISSGFGFIANIINPQSSDLWIPESNTFMSLAEAPHLILSELLMVSGFILFLKYLQTKKTRYIILGPLFFLILSFEHPANLIIVGITIFLTSIFSGISVYRSLVLAFINSFGIIFQIWQILTNPIINVWKAIELSPPPSSYISGFGLLIPFSVIGIEKYIHKDNKSYRLIIVWIFVTLFFLYAPFDKQRRIIEGVHIPLAILSTVGIFQILKKIKKTIRPWVIYVILILLSLSSLYLVINDVNNISKDSIRNNYYYYHISKPEYNGLMWLKEHTNTNDSILTNWFFGNILPGITGRKVYLGHKAQTENFDQKIKLINLFLLDQNTTTSLNFLKQNNITYIFLGNNDSMLEYGFKPDEKPYLIKVYDKNGVLIYKVSYNSNSNPDSATIPSR